VTVNRGRLAIAAALTLAAAAVSTILLLQHHGEPRVLAAAEQVCGPGSGCETVARSPYSRLAGLPVAGWGMVFYGSLTALLFLAGLSEAESSGRAACLGFLLLAAGLAVDVVLLGLQAFVIHAFCILCLSTYVLGALALVTLLPARRASPRPPIELPEGRVLVAGWILTSLAILQGTVVANAGLRARERVRVATLLGSAPASVDRPSPEPPSSPSPTTSETISSVEPSGDIESYRAAARTAQEQAKRLQETLDDPKKLEQYFTDKAMREYEQGPVHRLELEGVPRKGPKEAPVRVVEYSDFLCPYCRQLAGALQGFLPQTGKRMSVFFKNYPLDKECNPKLNTTIHPGACWLALGGLCAQDQAHFWEYHDKVFSSELHEPRGPDVVKLATEAGLDQAAMETCLVADRTRQRLSAQIEEAAKVGVQATPTVFVNGKKVPRLNDFIAVADKEAARLGLPPFPKPKG
jgi:protein-disulfide isomerase/uncharacterized membrane protein